MPVCTVCAMHFVLCALPRSSCCGCSLLPGCASQPARPQQAALVTSFNSALAAPAPLNPAWCCRGRQLFFYKRARIFVGDLWGCFRGAGLGAFADIDQLTMFAGEPSPDSFPPGSNRLLACVPAYAPCPSKPPSGALLASWLPFLCLLIV